MLGAKCAALDKECTCGVRNCMTISPRITRMVQSTAHATCTTRTCTPQSPEAAMQLLAGLAGWYGSAGSPCGREVSSPAATRAQSAISCRLAQCARGVCICTHGQGRCARTRHVESLHRRTPSSRRRLSASCAAGDTVCDAREAVGAVDGLPQGAVGTSAQPAAAHAMPCCARARVHVAELV